MPSISDNMRLSEEQDRRRKLSSEQKEEIKEEYATGRFSLNDLARAYGVSKKTILLTVNPESAEKQKKYIQENWREFKGTKEERAAAVRKWRRYKRELYLKGELK